MRSETQQVRDEVFSEVTYHASYEPMRSVRTERWKYIRRFHDRSEPILSNCDDSPSKDVWIEADWRKQVIQPEQLFDLTFDPNEACNLAGDPKAREPLEQMRRRLRAWMERTTDPLLHGHVPAPSGALINRPDALSPRDSPDIAP